MMNKHRNIYDVRSYMQGDNQINIESRIELIRQRALNGSKAASVPVEDPVPYYVKHTAAPFDSKDDYENPVFTHTPEIQMQKMRVKDNTMEKVEARLKSNRFSSQ